MYSGDEFYSDEVTSGLGDRDRDFDPVAAEVDDVPENVYCFASTVARAEAIARDANSDPAPRRGKFVAGSFRVDDSIQGRLPAVVGELAVRP
jgi:hypothetical protein